MIFPIFRTHARPKAALMFTPRWVRTQVQHPRSGGTAMYTLTLTAGERRSFDWVGSRYNSGKVADLLIGCIPESREWNDDGDITFQIPEHAQV